MKAVLFVAILIVVLQQAQAACECKKKDEPVANCTVHYDVCGCLHHLTEWRYKASATEVHCGVSGSADGFKSGEGAAEHATWDLFQKLSTCNCGSQQFPYGSCILEAKGCFQFADAGAVHSHTVQYKMWVKDVATSVTGYHCCAAKAEDAFQPAFADLSTKEDLSHCTAGLNIDEKQAQALAAQVAIKAFLL
eukprot:TRINITY_DN8901_c0_g1_i1.p1 TRINITY_DN8901_c0_g1~~TRINITY_DN8901_c0_g1_i1.p1  ORF type:complete len:192 (-),score=27.71 TRINITY_DN8901_c0_g1_i1:436-1011(-)